MKKMVKTVKITNKELFESSVKKLRDAFIDEPEENVYILFEEIFNISKLNYFLNKDSLVDESLLGFFNECLNKRIERIPIQHITNKAWFYGYQFNVNENVLIPRMDTEILVENSLEIIKSNLDKKLKFIKDNNSNNELIIDSIINNQNIPNTFNILDMCTGSGCIAISIYLELIKEYEPIINKAMNFNDSFITGLDNNVNQKFNKIYDDKDIRKFFKVYASDVSEKALKVAEENAAKFDADISFNHGDLFQNINEKFDFILSNPPYIESNVIDTLSDEVKKDPMLALDGGEDGLFFYRKIIDESVEFLKTDGYIAFEIGYNQGKAVSGLLKDKGFKNVSCIKDVNKLDRVVTGQFSN
ncbi:MAG: peptide chain release factor N(5)-glutamine methyltransferase [Lachnospiraceae bacterium]|nr:peptide chain release factor N(5)-glutamine methyltransferase [Lachnospiraceae bacterium]